MTPQPPRNLPLLIALWANAAVFAVIAFAMLTRPGLPSFLPIASAQNQPPIAGGAGVFVMPAQFSSNTWGAYLLDVDSQTLAAYQYLPAQRQLQLVAARTYRYDRGLQNFNTAAPSPREVEELLRMEERVRRGNPVSPASSPPPSTPGDSSGTPAPPNSPP